MFRVAVLIALSVPAPMAAESHRDLESDRMIEEGADLLSEGARRLLRGLAGEVGPEMRRLAETLREWVPEGPDLGDPGAFHPPEILPNGDIIIRRKTPREALVPPDGEIDL